jgi:transposase InsO family protein
MQENGLSAVPKPRFRRTTDSNHEYPIAPNLLERRFTAARPNEVWVGDITYVWTEEGWLYLAVLLDLFSRRVVGWAVSTSIDQQLTLSALRMAVECREPAAGLVHHSDRGSQYAATVYRRALAQRGIKCSMSRKGDCLDNAVAESFFATLEKELRANYNFVSRSSARSIIADYIENFYNPWRRHSSINYQSPIQHELTAGAA